MAKITVILFGVIAIISSVSGLSLDQITRNTDGSDSSLESSEDVDSARTASNADLGTSKFDPQSLMRLIAHKLNDIKIFSYLRNAKTEAEERRKRKVNNAGHGDSHQDSEDTADLRSHGHGSSSTAHSFSTHLLDFILAQVQKGHVTSNQMTHWMTSITWGLAHGSITSSQFEEFKQKLAHILPAPDPSKTDSGSNLWFG